MSITNDLTSKEIKAALCQWASFQHSPLLVMDEFANAFGYSDIGIVLKSMMWIDVEIKISISDLKAELKKPRHKVWDHAKFNSPNLPNYYVFCVRSDIAESAEPFIREHWPKAGILTAHLVVPENYYTKPEKRGIPVCTIRICKKMQRIHTGKIDKERLFNSYRSMSFRYARLYVEANKREWINHNQQEARP